MRGLKNNKRIIAALLARFAKDRSGALLSLEFALVGPAFIALMLALFELGLLMLKTAMLDLSVSEATKSIYTGAAQTGGQTQDDIKKYICEKSLLFNDCEENITVELTPISSFASTPTDAPTCVNSKSGEIAPAVDYSAGNGGAIMFMRVCVTTDVVTPGLGLGVHLVKSSGSNRMQIVSSAAFMNEPF